MGWLKRALFGLTIEVMAARGFAAWADGAAVCGRLNPATGRLSTGKRAGWLETVAL